MQLESKESNPYPCNGKMSPEKGKLIKLREEVKLLKMEK
jgi:hypothetical protein